MKHYWKATILIAFLFLAAASQGQTRKVFAHYMLAIGTEDNSSVEGFKRDVREAMAAGIDGFALNFGAWEPRYKVNIKNMVEAIDEIDSDFVFFLSVDKSTNIPDSVATMLIKRYYNNKKYFRYKGKFFLSAWGGVKSAEEWENDVLSPLKSEGYDMYFVPFFYPPGRYSTELKENPNYDIYTDKIGRSWKGVLDGYFYFGVGAEPFYKSNSLLNSGEAASKACHENGLTFMAGVTPMYWQVKQPKYGRRYFDYEGDKGLIAEWMSIINKQKPEWVELVTWNDWDESTYFSPLANIGSYSQHVSHPENDFYKSHAGFAELNKYFIEWYKSGEQPSITKDKIFYFYRTHPMNTPAANDKQGPILEKVGDIKDDLYVTTLLMGPADLVVTTGNKEYVYHVKAGLSNTEVPFRAGRQEFKLMRDNKEVISGTGEDIKDNINVYNFIYNSGVVQ